MRTGTKFIREDSTSEALSLKAKSSVDPTLLGILTDSENGILKSGLLPQIDTSTPSGTKNLLGAITQAGLWDRFVWLMRLRNSFGISSKKHSHTAFKS